jgi:hypothetical protein
MACCLVYSMRMNVVDLFKYLFKFGNWGEVLGGECNVCIGWDGGVGEFAKCGE